MPAISRQCLSMSVVIVCFCDVTRVLKAVETANDSFSEGIMLCRYDALTWGAVICKVDKHPVLVATLQRNHCLSAVLGSDFPQGSTKSR